MAVQKDVVCGRDVDSNAIQTSPVTRWIHQGKRYYFCSLQCRDQFVANPEGYLNAAPG